MKSARTRGGNPHSFIMTCLVAFSFILAVLFGCQNPVESPQDQRDEAPYLRMLKANFEQIPVEGLTKSDGVRELATFGGMVWRDNGGVIGRTQTDISFVSLAQNSGAKWWRPVLEKVRGNAVIFPPNALDENVFIEMTVGVTSDGVLFHSVTDRAKIEVADGTLPEAAKPLLASLVKSLLSHADLEESTELGFTYTPGDQTADVDVDDELLQSQEKSLVRKIAEALENQNELIEVYIRINPDAAVDIEGGPVDDATMKLVRELVDSFESRVADRIEVRLEYAPEPESQSVEVVHGNLLSDESDLIRKIIKGLQRSKTKVSMTIGVEGEDYHLNLKKGYEAVLVTPERWLVGSPNVAVNFDDHGDYQSVSQHGHVWYFTTPHFSRWVWGILD